MGRKLLMPQQHTISRRAIKLWSKLRDRSSPTLPQSLDHLWRHDTWILVPSHARVCMASAERPPVHAFDAMGGCRGELASCMHSVYGGDIEVEECGDSFAHRYGRCIMVVAAWKWAQQVMCLLGLEYFGTMSGFWLYGGPKALIQRRAVSLMRGPGRLLCGAASSAMAATAARWPAGGE
jgi:hypothetical protein